MGLQMSSERQGERVTARRVAGKLFQMTGPVTAKLLIPSMVLVLGTDRLLQISVLRVLQISSKSVYFWRSYSRTHEHCQNAL